MCTCCELGQIAGIHLYSIIQCSFTTLKILCAPPIHPSSLKPWQVLTPVIFPECHTIGLTQYVTFSDWLLSLSNLHLGSRVVLLFLSLSHLLSFTLGKPALQINVDKGIFCFKESVKCLFPGSW